MKRHKTLPVLLLIFITVNMLAQVTSFRGPNSSGVFSELNLMEKWPEEGLEIVLQCDSIGKGWGSPVLVDSSVFVIGSKNAMDVLSCFTLDGTKRWERIIGKTWSKSFKESRSTPSIENDRVYSTSSTGDLSCFDILSGDLIWGFNIDSAYQGRLHRWGMAQSPMLVDSLVILVPGGDLTSMVALHKLTGELVWKTRSIGHDCSYATPVRYQHGMVDQIIGQTSFDVFAVNPENGEIIWVYPYMKRVEEITGSGRADIITNSPIIKENQIYISNGYDNISVMLEVSEDGTDLKERWTDRTLDCHHHGVVTMGDYIYGSNWYSNRMGKWVSLNWQTGEVIFVEKWNNKGVSIAADGMLYLLSEKPGAIALAKPDKDGLNIVSSFEIDFGRGEFWAHPFIADGMLLIRHGEEIRIYNIRKNESKAESN